MDASSLLPIQHVTCTRCLSFCSYHTRTRPAPAHVHDLEASHIHLLSTPTPFLSPSSRQRLFPWRHGHQPPPPGGRMCPGGRPPPSLSPCRSLPWFHGRPPAVPCHDALSCSKVDAIPCPSPCSQHAMASLKPAPSPWPCTTLVLPLFGARPWPPLSW
jgi:hypothetical protein